MERYLDATNDVAFKKIFQDENRLKAFLNATLRLEEGKRIQKIVLLPSNEIPDIGQGKQSLFDLKCTDEAGNIFVVEMQNGRETHFLKRAQYYAAKTYAAQLKKGDTYDGKPSKKKKPAPVLDTRQHHGLMPVIVVAITNHELFPDHIDCVSFHRTLEEKTKEQHLFALSYVFIELPKFTKSAEKLETIEDEWLHFLKYSEEEQTPPQTIKDKYVLNAYEVLERYNWSDVEYDAYIRAQLRTEINEYNLAESFQKGIEEGIEKGREEGRQESQAEITKAQEEASKAQEEKHRFIQGMFKKNMDMSLIMEIAGVTKEELEELKKEVF